MGGLWSAAPLTSTLLESLLGEKLNNAVSVVLASMTTPKIVLPEEGLKVRRPTERARPTFFEGGGSWALELLREQCRLERICIYALVIAGAFADIVRRQ